ncbi:MAG: hypothetical protein HETSPECPRED_001904 [Heterodermia speciosa]|uniref:Uncharacterized protein n=1 Tax=Heterodermia speciosa TaxID=116794 RepID=A0A8H3J337_9LECA|nr:MAG: hypothetical protein HETSPECPRED_001904 [Heterodermia speciosa]
MSSPSFPSRLQHLRTPLRPLISITTGLPHPLFPATLLHYHLLTTTALDDLAHYYHQRTPSEFSFGYPLPVVQRWHSKATPSANSPTTTKTIQDLLGFASDPQQSGNESAELEAKRRRFGRFVGLRGCESPSAAVDEGEMRREMERWVANEMRKREEREAEKRFWREKGCW